MSKPFLFTRVGYSYVPTTNIHESINWYVENLELRLIDKFEDRGSLLAVLQYPHSHATALLLIETNEYKPLEINRNGAAFPIMAMNCPDIDYSYNKLKDNGVDIVKELTSLGAGEARYFYFRDNQGNLLEGAWSIWDPQDEIKDEFLS
ncbi:VOC family protein [Paenibacillus eucommiae]|uniref:Catechol 2,3-dioxygenase-like lactoylglutathione lyase family enzyme n=1 Tax=Paenibacillus eucommiae TaxID=1355755 RepID=A0ABS4IVM0_9BACL|nr:VOC family protein [Paenibacillus eucommiae]MBP1990599.1 catechol 2,3-dioxygenase-like lactoylglutathione lyase family enzyme [Paenibacillus eucommiae]